MPYFYFPPFSDCMLRVLSCSIIALLITHISHAQRPVFIGAEISYSKDYYQVSDPGGQIVQAQLSSALYGLTIRKMISSRFYVESGIYTRQYQEGIGLKGIISTGGTGRKVGQLPLRIGASLPVLKKRFFIRPVAGLVLNVAGKKKYSNSWGDVSYPDGNILHYEYDYKYQTDVFFLVQAGLSVDLRLGKKCFLGISANHYEGLQKIHIQQIKYGMNNDPFSAASTSSKGNFCSVGAVFSYQLGN
jgi:hypothetical protein